MRGGRPGRGAGGGGRDRGGPKRGAPSRGGFDPHARTKTKRYRDRKDESGGRAASRKGDRDDDRKFVNKFAGKSAGKPGGKPGGKFSDRSDRKPGGRGGFGDKRGSFGEGRGGRDRDDFARGPRKSFSKSFGDRPARRERPEREGREDFQSRTDFQPRSERGGERSGERGGGRNDHRGGSRRSGARDERNEERRFHREASPRSFKPRFARDEDREGRSEKRSFKPQRERGGEGRSEYRNDRGGERRPVYRDEPVIEQAAAPKPALPKPTFESAGVQTITVTGDEHDMRVDRFFEARFPGLSFSHIQRIIRKGEVRVNGKRTEPKARLERGQQVRIPPLKLEAPTPREDAPGDLKDRAFIKSITLYEDDDVMVLNKPMGLAVQGGSGTTRHVDGMLAALTPMGRDARRPRLVHRLDKDTAGCLLVAKTRFAAAALAKTFRSRAARKIYWALVYGVPKPKQGRISTFLAKEQMEEDSYMRVAEHGEEGASHAVTYYAVVESAAHQLSWVSLKPVTGRTHQLRAHMAHIRHPIVGDPKYFNIENWQFPGGLQNKLHLHAHRIAVPHPRGGRIDVTAPLPPHMEQTWNLLGFDAKRYDPIEEAPEED